MTKKPSSEQSGEATVVAVRLPPDLLAGLDRAVVQASAPPYSHPSRSVVARGLIASALQTPLFTTEAPSQPTFQKKAKKPMLQTEPNTAARNATKEQDAKAPPSEPVATAEMVTPEIAAQWLKRNIGNRPVVAARVKKYAAEILSGTFALTHQGIAFDTRGVLIDGQHRLLAVVAANKPAKLMVSRGWPTTNRELIDTGAGRNASQVLALRFSLTRTEAEGSAAILRGIYLLEGDDKQSIKAAELIAAYSRLEQSIIWARKYYSGSTKSASIPTPAIAALAWTYARAPKVAEYVAAKFLNPTGLEEGSPVIALQRAANRIGGFHTPEERRSLSLKALRAIEAVMDRHQITRLEASQSTLDRMTARIYKAGK